MNTWLIQVKREFWEYQSSFVIMPLVIAALVVIACSYVVIMHSSADSGNTGRRTERSTLTSRHR